MTEVKVGDLLIRIKNTIELSDNEEYKRITIRSKHQGVFLRDKIYGKDIGTKKQFIVNKGQFLLSKIDARNGAFGIVLNELDGAIITGNFWTYEVNNTLLNIELFNIITSLPFFDELCKKSSSGTTNRQYLDEDKFLNQKINLPHKKDQDTFIKQFNLLKEKQSNLQKEYTLQKETILKLKSQILQDAIMGKLTTQNPNDKAIDLLNSIKEEKEKLVKEKKIKKEKPLSPIDKEEIPFKIPDNWEYVRLGHIILNIFGGGTPSKTNTLFWEKGNIPWASVKDLNQEKYLDNTIDMITKKGLKEGGTKLVKKGNIIISTRMGLGKILINKIDTAINQDLKSIKLPNEINQDFFFYFYKTYELKGKGTTVSGIKQEDLLSLYFYLPPLEEQKRIVEKVDIFYEKLDIVQKECEKNLEYANQLLQSVLKEAFKN